MFLVISLLLVPALAGIAAFVVPGTALRRGLLLLAALAHAGLTAVTWWQRPAFSPEAWLGLDAPEGGEHE